MNSRVILIMLLATASIFSSCVMRKIEYVKNMSPDELYAIKAAEVIKIQPNDRLSIRVHSKNIELSAPFNTNLGGYTLATESEIIKSANSDDTFENGYTVNSEGFINFPILGRIKVGGMSIEEIEKLIAHKIKSNNYIDDPLVKASLLNFKIMTMGTIKNQVLTVPDGKITLLEAIVQAGGLVPNSDASNVMVIREEDGQRKMIVSNLEDVNMFNSEAYYLQQNDVVYVAPKYKQVTPGTQSVWQMAGMLFGVLSLGLAAAALYKK